MKILKLLNNRNLSIIFFLLLLCPNSHSEDKPIDIWQIGENKKENVQEVDSIKKNDDKIKISPESNIYNMQNQKQANRIQLDSTLISKEIKIFGLFDPDDYGLDINMWSNSNGDQLKNIFSSLSKLDLSNDATEIMNIVMLTNAYYPNKDITEKEFSKIKSDWLIKNADLDLISEYLLKNQIINHHPELTRFLIDQYLSQSNIEKACDIFFRNSEPISDPYLSKFNIYCLVNSGKNNEAQLILDLKKELGFKDDYFETKMNYLFGYDKTVDKTISEKSILNFHLAHRTNPEFLFEPRSSTSKIIWRYLSSYNLLYDVKDLDITELDKISTIEKATHEKNYSENDLYELYKKFQFNINQLLNAKDSYKSLSKIEARALIYQKILLESETNKKIELIKLLKEMFIKENISRAFENELTKLLKTIKPESVSADLSSFYASYIQNEENSNKKIKFNNDIMHQSKLVNYFNGDYAKSKIEKDVNNFLKKIRKDKKYFFSKKDVIFLEALKSDGINISKKYDNLYEINESEIPTDIQVMINNNEIGPALLRITEVIGQDKLERIDEDTMFFIISTLNQLDIDLIRNKILLKVLPLKV
tara:strand:+ start:456 stop:2228 length:1773 start_codon:yes stop_codon:yes gene_type:complete